MDQFEHIAEQILKEHGSSLSEAQRAGSGWTNTTWLTDSLALRLSKQQGSDKIRREVELASLLPKSAGYPENLATGISEGYEWSLSKRIRGVNLSEVWPGLSWNEKEHAVRQVWDIIQAVHSVDIKLAEPLSKRRAWYNSCDVIEAKAAVGRLIQKGFFSVQQGMIFTGILARFEDAVADAGCVLNHGDVTMDNLLWNGGDVVCLMDFENSVIAPPQIDIRSFLQLSFSLDEQPPQTAVDRKSASELQQAALALVKPCFESKKQLDLLFGYEVLFYLFMFELWLSDPEGEGEVEQWTPYRALLSLAKGDGGNLSAVLKM